MLVYFVRHGESIFNKELRHQFPNTPLSKDGLAQAKSVASRFQKISVELILTSPYTRALQTAQEIEKVKKIPLIENEYFVERRMPSVFDGKKVDDPKIVPIHDEIRKNFHKADWHYADEENFVDLLVRADRALAYIQEQKKESVVVVTHGYFLNVMMYLILFGRKAEESIFKHMKDRITYSNTGLTVCQYKDGKWKLLTLNDYAHLGE